MNKDGPTLKEELGPCWEWEGKRTKDGYGVVATPEGRQRRAHLVSWEFSEQAIPEGLQADHLCRNPPCVRPSHLEPVTPLENTRRAFLARKVCHNGHELAVVGVVPGSLVKCRQCRRDTNNRASRKFRSKER